MDGVPHSEVVQKKRAKCTTCGKWYRIHVPGFFGVDAEKRHLSGSADKRNSHAYRMRQIQERKKLKLKLGGETIERSVEPVSPFSPVYSTDSEDAQSEGGAAS